MLFYIGLSNFLDISPQTSETKAKINKWDLFKLKSFCKAKETIRQTKKQHTKWEKLLVNDTSDKGSISKVLKKKKLIQLNIKKDNPIKKWAEDLNRCFSKRNTNGQQMHEKMLNITNHEGNANQNHNEVYHTCQNSYCQKDSK